MRRFVCGVLFGAMVFPIVALVVVLFGGAPVEAIADPPRWEAVLGRKLLASAVARQAPKLENPVAPTSENLRAGLKIYRDDCAGCHGESGKPSRWGTTSFYPRVPQFGSEPTRKPDWQVFWVVKYGVRYTGMAAWDRLLSEDDMWKVATYLTHADQLATDVGKE